jgi:hypothetical protein
MLLTRRGPDGTLLDACRIGGERGALRSAKALVRFWARAAVLREEPQENYREKYRALRLSLDYVEEADVKGDLAEFGTMSGKTASVLSYALARLGSKRALLLFDSFKGLPEATSEVDRSSPHVQSGVWGANRCLDLSSSELRSVCEAYLPSGAVRIHEGWFSESLPKANLEAPLALVHVDCDMYQSTVDVLEFLFSNGKVAEGGVLLFDDWNTNRADPKFGERRAWSECVERYGVSCSDWGAYGWSGQRFIVHSYRGGCSPR